MQVGLCVVTFVSRFFTLFLYANLILSRDSYLFTFQERILFSENANQNGIQSKVQLKIELVFQSKSFHFRPFFLKIQTLRLKFIRLGSGH